MTLANNSNIIETQLRSLHPELLQWARFCVDFETETAKDLLQ